MKSGLGTLESSEAIWAVTKDMEGQTTKAGFMGFLVLSVDPLFKISLLS